MVHSVDNSAKQELRNKFGGMLYSNFNERYMAERDKKKLNGIESKA